MHIYDVNHSTAGRNCDFMRARPPTVPFYGRSLHRDRAVNKIPDGDLIALN